jgi:Mrp family chromosome partitioning ATPase
VSWLYELEMIVVSGKGGVGRTTVSAALASAAARAGKRVLVAASGATDRLGPLFGLTEPIGPKIVNVAPGVDAVNMTPETALHEYGVLVLRSEAVTRAVFDNRAVRGFLGAVPGLDGYALLGKAWWHTTERASGRRRYDLVLFDAPATGHATLMLKIPDSILAAMPKGPLARDARAIRDLLSDPARAALLIVTLAEELPAREAAELAAAARGPLRLPLAPLVVNAVPGPIPDGAGLGTVLDRAAASDGAGDPALWSTLRLATAARAQRRQAETILARLRADLGLPMIALPRLLTGASGPAALAQLEAALSAKIDA